MKFLICSHQFLYGYMNHKLNLYMKNQRWPQRIGVTVFIDSVWVFFWQVSPVDGLLELRFWKLFSKWGVRLFGFWLLCSIGSLLQLSVWKLFSKWGVHLFGFWHLCSPGSLLKPGIWKLLRNGWPPKLFFSSHPFSIDLNKVSVDLPKVVVELQ
jgi:hypothetical protein